MHSFCYCVIYLCSTRTILHVLPLQHDLSMGKKTWVIYSNCSSFIKLWTSQLKYLFNCTNHVNLNHDVIFFLTATHGHFTYHQNICGLTLGELAACRYWRRGWDSGGMDKAISVSIAKIRWLFPLQRTGMILVRLKIGL